MNRIEELEVLIKKHQSDYENAQTTIPDSAYDKLLEELRALAPNHPLLGCVGAPVPSYGKKLKHLKPMGSLTKEKGLEGIYKHIKQWQEKLGKTNFEIVLSWKIDGLAISLTYENGDLIKAVTRGDGYEGQDVMDNVKFIDAIPKKVHCQATTEFRGEVYMPVSVWKSSAGAFANPRNGASGQLMQKDPEKTGKYQLGFMAYDVLYSNNSTEAMKAGFAKANGFRYINLTAKDSVNFLEWCTADAIAELDKQRADLDYGTDGLVISLNQLDQQEELGYNGVYPEFKFAFKFPSKQTLAKVNGLTWKTGRTGVIVPLLEIEPTFLDGSTITNISLHSLNKLSMLNEEGLGLDCTVLFEKANDIIPQVVGVEIANTDQSKHFNYPTNCPACKNPTEIKGAHLYCVNDDCNARKLNKIIYWVKTLELDGVGESTITELYENGYIKTAVDLYHVTEEQIKDVTGGDTSSSNVFNEIHAKRQIPLGKFIAGLGVRLVGDTYGERLEKVCHSISDVKALGLEELTKLMGQAAANSLVDYLNKEAAYVAQLEGLFKFVTVIVEGPLSGKSFCITGALSRPREEIAKDIIAKGGNVSDSVKKDLSYLVQADPKSESSKSLKAVKYGVTIISEEELYKLMEV